MPLKILIHKFSIQRRQQNHETTHDSRIILKWKPKVWVTWMCNVSIIIVNLTMKGKNFKI